MTEENKKESIYDYATLKSESELRRKKAEKEAKEARDFKEKIKSIRFSRVPGGGRD